MEKSRHSNGSPYQFDDVVIDRDVFQLRKADALKALTPRAFDLLIYLIEQRGRVVEKQELFEQVWKETFVTDNALMRAVKEIRRELGDDASAPRYIETVHKRGYRFIAELKDTPNKGLNLEAAADRDDPSELSEAPRGRRIADEAADQGPGPGPSLSMEQMGRLSARRKALAGLSLAVLAIAIAVFVFSRRGEVAIHSLAVLPLENASTDQNAEYLSDGITESLINSLSQLSQLRVMPRSTAFRYKGQQGHPEKVGRELGVDAVLTGRVSQQAENLIIQAELTMSADGSQLWGERYHRKPSEIFSLQEEIAKEISGKLRLKLRGEEENRLAKRYTENAEAYELLLRGRYHLNKLRPPEIQSSISYFQQAIALDRSYALAHVGLANAYRALALSAGMPATEFFPQSKAAAQKAIEIDSTLAEAHAGLGFAILFYDWDWKTAEKQYKRALELNQNSAETHLAYAGLLTIIGRHAEGLAEAKRARELDPLDLRTSSLEGQFLTLAGRADEGLARLQKTLELEPNFFPALLFSAGAHIEKGMYTEAVAEAIRARDVSGGNAEAISSIGYALAMSGKRRDAQAMLDELRKRTTERYVPPYAIALLYHVLGERDEAFGWLERGMEQRDSRMIFLWVDPKWKTLRDDPRFTSLLKRLNLPTEVNPLSR